MVGNSMGVAFWEEKNKALINLSLYVHLIFFPQDSICIQYNATFLYITKTPI